MCENMCENMCVTMFETMCVSICVNMCVNMCVTQGPHAEIISPYFLHMKSFLVGGISLGEIDVTNLRKTSVKSLYAGFISSFPPPKIVFKYNIQWS